MARYWELEQPKQVITSKNMLKWYQRAGKLQIAGTYKDQTGEVKQGKTSTLDLEDLATNPGAIELIESFLKEAKESTI